MPTRLNSPATRIVAAYLQDHPGTTTTGMAKATGLGRSTVTKALAALEAAGQVTRVRGSRNGATVNPDSWYLVTRQPATSKSDPDTKAENAARGETTSTPRENATQEQLTPSTGEAPTSVEVNASPPDTPAPLLAAEGVAVPLDAQATGPQKRLRSGQLMELVTRFLAEHPGEEYTAADIARMLERSGGAVHNVLQKLLLANKAQLTCLHPRRYQTI